MKHEILSIFPTNTEHGEGPIWHDKENCFYWVDLLKGKYFKGNPDTLFVKEYSINQPLGVLAIRQKGGFAMAVRDGFGLVDFAGEKLKLINPSPEKNNSRVRFNDGAVDPLGRFFAGTMEWDGNEKIGKLFRLNSDYSYTQINDGYYIPNGMGWSSDNKTMFIIDTLQHVMFAFDYDLESGEVSNKRIHVQFDIEEFPDGMAIDSTGGFWVALWGGSKLIRLDPSGKKIEDIPLPVPYPTSCCFGGPNLNKLFITSSRIKLSKEEILKYPLSGNTFLIETDLVGRKENRFKEI